MGALAELLPETRAPSWVRDLGRARNVASWSKAAEARINDTQLNLSHSQGGGGRRLLGRGRLAAGRSRAPLR
eukprot:12283897-Alexandrium_andersonii.AAC.1